MVLHIPPGPWLNPFDLEVETFFSHIAGRWPWLDFLIFQLNINFLPRGGVLMMLAWLAVFDWKRAGRLREGFEIVLGASLMGTLGTAAARLIVHFGPYRVRPFNFQGLAFPHAWEDVPQWGCFPSDHAVLFLAIAIGVYFASRRLGWIAIAWSLFAICLPRLYEGAHWPTDILAGGILALACAWLASLPAPRKLIRESVIQLNERHPQIFLVALFVWTFSIATIFTDVRNLGGGILYYFVKR